MSKEKTDVQEIEVSLLQPNPRNPNVMSDAKFNSLAEGIEKDGMIEPVAVVPVEGGMYEIVSGEHRWRACRTIGRKTIPCVILDPNEWTDDKRQFYLIRMNIVKGNIDSEKFISMYNDLQKKYNKETLNSLMALEENEFNKLYKTVRAALPQEMRSQLDKTKKELKTVDDLAMILNTLFTNHGKTLEYGWMAFTFGSKVHYWIKLTPELKTLMEDITKISERDKKSLPDMLTRSIQLWKEENL